GRCPCLRLCRAVVGQAARRDRGTCCPRSSAPRPTGHLLRSLLPAVLPETVTRGMCRPGVVLQWAPACACASSWACRKAIARGWTAPGGFPHDRSPALFCKRECP